MDLRGVWQVDHHLQGSGTLKDLEPILWFYRDAAGTQDLRTLMATTYIEAQTRACRALGLVDWRVLVRVVRDHELLKVIARLMPTMQLAKCAANDVDLLVTEAVVSSAPGLAATSVESPSLAPLGCGRE